MRKKKFGVVLALLLFISTPILTFAADTKEAVENSTNIYETDNSNEFNKFLEKEIFNPSNDEIPYQEVPKITDKSDEKIKTNDESTNKLTSGGNEKAVSKYATKENKARGTVMENVNQNGVDITPKTEEIKDKENTNDIDVRQFLTFQTKSGKTLHLIVDHGSSSSNVQLLTEVSEQDLLNMIEDDGKLKVEEPKKEEVVKKEEVKEEPKQEKKESSAGTYILLFIIVGAVAGASYYFKVVKKKEDTELEDFEEDDNEFVEHESEEETKEETDDYEELL